MVSSSRKSSLDVQSVASKYYIQCVKLKQQTYIIVTEMAAYTIKATKENSEYDYQHNQWGNEQCINYLILKSNNW